MITPFAKEGGVDFKGVEALTEWYWKKGCDGIFAVCQSGEIFYLTLNERVEIAKTVVDTARKLAEKDKSRKSMTIVVSGHISSSFDDQAAELNAMGVLTVQKKGAIPSLHTRAGLEEFLRSGARR